MSLKDLFRNRESFKHSSLKSADEVAREVEESSEYLEQYRKDRDRFIPAVNYSDPAKFARYGSAEKYYEDAIERIYRTYPYDGSLREVLEWHNSSSFIDKHVFENEYPRTNGYALFSADGWGTLDGSQTDGYGAPSSSDYEYIFVKGGPHTGSNMLDLQTGFSASNVYHTASKRESNLQYDLDEGVTVEFWLKKDSFTTALTEKEVVFDLWNGENSSSISYGRLRVELTGASTGSPFLITALSGTSGFQKTSIGTNLTTTSLTDWGHYAVTFINGASDVTASLYVNGDFNQKVVLGSTAINEVTGALRAYIGALIEPPSGSQGAFKSIPAGAGKLSASLDEFRFWKTKRTSEEIGRNWFTNVYGGTNSDKQKYDSRNPVDLGVYYKFNEGITGVTATDSVVLDYSGRLSNGSWTGYDTYSRNIGSAIVSASAAKTEFKDPIIYSEHPDVENYLSQKKTSGSAHDFKNNAALYNMLPRWVIDEDIETQGNIKNLTQMLGSYFDTLHLQIQSLSTLREATYSTYSSASLSASAKPLPFANRLVESMGLSSPELFIDADIIEKITSRDEKRNYEESIHDVKNLIYQNIYNNLAYIYKSKGTEKAFRNLIRCFGIDDELVRFNTYGQNALFKFRNNHRSTVINKTLVNFAAADNFGATVYQYPSGSELGYIPGSTLLRTFPQTIEAEIVFPRKRHAGENGYFHTAFFSASLFGAHEATTSTTDTTWKSGDNVSTQVYAIRTSSLESDYDTKAAYFMLSSSAFQGMVTSSVFPDVYDDRKWNFAVRVKHDEHELNNMVIGTTGSDRTYSIELHGVNVMLGEVIDEFTVSSRVDKTTAEDFIAANKRLYVGAHRTNFTGAVLQSSDVKVSSIRFWYDYIENDEIAAHAKDSTNLGVKNPHRNLSLFHSGTNNIHIPSFQSLALNWDFETITGSGAGGTDSSGDFVVQDFSSGSSTLVDSYGEYSTVTGRKYPGKGDHFPANATASVDKSYIQIAKQQLPEFIYSDDMVSIIDEDDVTFTRESRPTQFYFAAEKSMYQTISEEMINMFATIVDFNNTIGEPVYRYRHEYKQLNKLRELFYSRIENTPDLDKYIDFYKWVDNAISSILVQLTPASANASENLRNMIESHVLERSKYRNKIPSLKDRDSSENLVASPGKPVEFPGLYGDKRDDLMRDQLNRIASDPPDRIAGRAGGWRFNHEGRTSPPNQAVHSSWWKNRAERNHPSITSGDAGVDRDRTFILSASSPYLDSFSRRGRSVAANFVAELAIDGGTNFSKNKRMRYAHQATTEFGPRTVFSVGPFGITASNNFVLFRKDDFEEFFDSNDEVIPPELVKRKWKFTAYNNSDVVIGDSVDYHTMKGDTVVPFNVVKHNNLLSGGYHGVIATNFKEGVDFVNVHNDVYGPDNSSGMQGPFAHEHVGGLQYRHVAINKYDPGKSTTNKLDDQSTRPEGWFLLFGSLATGEESVGIVGPTYTTADDYDKDTPRARLYRGLTTRSPVNIRNVRTTGSVLGNYSSSVEYVQTVGRTQNNAYFKENSGVSLPPRYRTTLPATTNVHTLVAATVDDPTEDATGNYFGVIISEGEELASLRFVEQNETEANIFTLPRRDLTGSDSVIVSRFSAPGGPEINTRGFLDIIAEEHSVYNALPFRNLSVRSSASGEAGTIRSNVHLGAGREGLRTLITRRQGLYGIDSQHGSVQTANYDTIASYHKIPRNILRRIEYSDELSGHAGTTTTASVFNNGWIQTPIPRSDLQYTWFTASFHSYPANTVTLGHAPADGLVSSSATGIVAAYNFVSASETTNSSGISTAFAAHNTIVVDGLISSQNLLSASNFPNGYISGLAGITHVPDAINSVTLLRNGPYQYPSWKQTRTGENQIARYQRKNNILSITTQPDKIFTSSPIQSIVPQMKGGVLRQFTMPPVTSKYKPLFHILKTPNGGAMVDSGLKYTHANNKGMFPMSEVDFILNTKNKARLAYDDLTDIYVNPADGKLKGEFSLLSYQETVYPKSENTYLNNSRNRVTFVHPRWRTNREDRKGAAVANSLNQTVPSQSTWPLDARIDFTSSTVSTPATGSGTGELQNAYTIFHGGNNLGSTQVSTKSVRFTRNSYMTASVGHSSGMLNRTFASASTISLWAKTTTTRLSQSVVARGGGKDNKQTYELRFHNGSIYGNVGHTFFGASELKVTPSSWPSDEWAHIALCWETSSAGIDFVKIYLNGELQTADQGGTVGTGTGSLDGDGENNIFTVGAINNSSSLAGPIDIHTGDGDAATEKNFKGYLDELTFFSGAASAAEISTIYNSGSPIDIMNTSFTNISVISHYRMGEHANDGPLGNRSGIIQDTGPNGVSLQTGSLSASYLYTSGNGFGAANFGIKTAAPYNAGSGGNTNLFGALYNRPIPDRDTKGTETDLYLGDVLWEAASQAGKEPFYDSYNDYREDFRGLAKDYGIIPEFRISDHMEFYIDTKGGNFLADNSDFLTLTGAVANKTSSAQTDFFKTYTNTDFLKFFDVVKEEHESLGYSPSQLVLKCNSLIKFIPYEGFYPATRTLQLATLFSQSFSENLAHKDTSAASNADAFGSQVSFRTFLAPMFAPGVLYNSIKSGIAVDYPIMTSSFTVGSPEFDSDSELSSSFRISSSFGHRIPFEALAEPEGHLAGISIVDQEPHISASIDSTASYVGGGGPLFEAAMNNFIAEVPKFFLQNGGVTSLISEKDDNKKHYKAELGKEYRMRVVLRNSKTAKRRQIVSAFPRDNSGGQDLNLTGAFITNPTITMYSRRSAFGPPCAADHIDFKESFEPFTPPYMDGYSDVEFTFTPTETRFFFVDEIVSALTSSFFRVGEQYFTVGSGGTSVAFTNQMQISSSVNLLDIARTKKATFDPVTGETIQVEDDETAPSVAIIQTKWECPILDFSNVSVTPPAVGSGSTKGMWHQFGVEPSINNGVYLEVQDLAEQELLNPALTGSLADLMGFSKRPAKLGQVVEEKTVREAVVAIPFFEKKNGRKQFFNINRRDITTALNIMMGKQVNNPPGDSIINMVEKMQNYVFPPKFDFLTNSTIKPMAMYIFEFEHTFSKQDLIDMWQNLPPEIGRKFESQTATVSHPLLKNEIMKGEMKDKLRWMVFKVKQRAAENYYAMLKDSVTVTGFEFDIQRGQSKGSANFDYTYNWPYDFFSIVEMVKMDAEVVIDAPEGSSLSAQDASAPGGTTTTTTSPSARPAPAAARSDEISAMNTTPATQALTTPTITTRGRGGSGGGTY